MIQTELACPGNRDEQKHESERKTGFERTWPESILLDFVPDHPRAVVRLIVSERLVRSARR
jgi:hypothetical protein